MTATSLITMRETLEASLVVGIVLSYLTRTENLRHVKFVWLGVLAGIVGSIGIAVAFQLFAGGFTGRAKEIFEGSTMLVAAGLLTWMIVWMLRQGRHMQRQIEGEVASHVDNNHPLGIFLLAFVAVLREGAETVIFLQAAILNAQAGAHLIGFLLGLGSALLLAYVFFKGSARLPLRHFFSITSALLLLFAAGLVAHGIHEFQEAGLLMFGAEQAWNINPTVVSEGVYPLFHERGIIGQFLTSIFGYNGNPSRLEILAYGVYIVSIALIWKRQASR